MATYEQGDLGLGNTPRPKRRSNSHLAEPLTKEERKRFGELYVEHQGLIRLLGCKMCRKYQAVDKLDIYSCIDIGFLKTCRAFDPTLGFKFSTLLTRFCEGTILHFMRDHNWHVKAPKKVRELGMAARNLATAGYSVADTMRVLGVSRDELRLAIAATAGIYHEQNEWEGHACQRPTPMERLEAEEMAGGS
jgi:DNA-directed RNA polymerase specialized sigma subunit